MRTARIRILFLLVALLFVRVDASMHPVSRPADPPRIPADSTIVLRFQPPPGFYRTPAPAGSFPEFLRLLPLKEVGAPVRLYHGGFKNDQSVHAAVVDLSVGRKDLQQCADAIIRLRAEFLYASGREEEIAFRFTNGFRAEWKRWSRGERIIVEGNRCRWAGGGVVENSHAQLLLFLEKVFTYAGSLSLQGELEAMARAGSEVDLRIGDVFIQGGSPGHAVIVVDAASSPDGRTALLLAQSFMPAQDIHVLKNKRRPELGAWFILAGEDRLYTPEWTFGWGDRRNWP